MTAQDEFDRQRTRFREAILRAQAGVVALQKGHLAAGDNSTPDFAGLRVFGSDQTSESLTFTTMGDLLLEPEEVQSWLVQDRLIMGGLSLLAGKPKAGKSTLARCLALAVARGEPWLGFKTERGLVFYLALEEKRAEVRSHFRAMGATVDDPIELFISPSPRNGLAYLRAASENRKPSLIIIDPLLKLVRVRDANDYAVMTEALEPLLSLARETGAHVMAVHHLGKGDRSDGDAILGSTAIFGVVDSALFLKRTESYRTLRSDQRYGENLEEITLELNKETRTITAGLPKKEADEEQKATALLDFLKTQTTPLAEKEMSEAVEGRRELKIRALRRLVEEGKVIRTGDGKRGNPYMYSCSGSRVPHISGEPGNQY